MRVIHNNQMLFVGWRYDDKNNPQVTQCILTNKQKDIIKTVTVKKHFRDTQSKDKARRYSLDKLLKELCPGRENREQRKLFWEAYIHRNDKKEAIAV